MMHGQDGFVRSMHHEGFVKFLVNLLPLKHLLTLSSDNSGLVAVRVTYFQLTNELNVIKRFCKIRS